MPECWTFAEKGKQGGRQEEQAGRQEPDADKGEQGSGEQPAEAV